MQMKVFLLILLVVVSVSGQVVKTTTRIIPTSTRRSVTTQQVIVGPPGPTGPQGPQGPRGDRGEQGPQGTTGPPGATGEKGDRGEPGRPAFAAPPGVRGDRGYTGAQGSQGATGPKGEKGPKGETGEIGRRGQQGRQGPKGEMGPPGPTGFQGPPGSRARSIRGPKGDMGDMGAPGRAGVPGEPGLPGRQGPPGPPGLDDTSGRCPCNTIDAATLAAALAAPAAELNKISAYFFASLSFSIDNVPTSSPVISFGNVLLSDGTSYDSGSGIFTAPISGVYMFLISIMPTQGTTSSVVMRRLMTSSMTPIDVETFTCISGPRLATTLGPADPVMAFATRQMLQLDQGDKIWMELVTAPLVADSSYFAAFLLHPLV